MNPLQLSPAIYACPMRPETLPRRSAILPLKSASSTLSESQLATLAKSALSLTCQTPRSLFALPAHTF